MAESPIDIVQFFKDYKVDGIRFHIRARSANNKTYWCRVVVKGTMAGDLGGLDYYEVLKEALKVEYLGEPIKHHILFHRDWFDPLKLPGMRYYKINCTYKINLQHKYAKYNLFILVDVVYQVFYNPIPIGCSQQIKLVGCFDKQT